MIIDGLAFLSVGQARVAASSRAGGEGVLGEDFARLAALRSDDPSLFADALQLARAVARRCNSP